MQSFTLAAMAALGEIEKPDVAIHADTTHEASWTYAHAKKWTPWLEEYGIVVVVVANHEKKNIITKWGGMQLPAYTASKNGDGQIRRQCTYEWKIRPMRQWIQVHRNNEPVEMWLGISTDETLRMKNADVKYITNRYPLIEMHMSRLDCAKWLHKHQLDIPKKSACTFCPYHTTNEWRQVKQLQHDWSEAIGVDTMIRHARPPQDLFLHPSRKPLEEVDFRTLEEMGQMRLWDEECSGICGV